MRSKVELKKGCPIFWAQIIPGAIILLGTSVIAVEGWGADDCSRHLLPEAFTYSMRIHQSHPQFHTTPEVEALALRRKRSGLGFSLKPAEKIYNYLGLLERIHARASANSVVKERIRRNYHEKFVIREDQVPDSYFQNQQRLNRERGHGEIAMSTTERARLSRTVIQEQKASLDDWFDYFLSADSDSYPFFAKYWAFTSILKLSKYNAELGTFAKRGPGTTAPFPELNREALALVIDHFIQKMAGKAAIFPSDDPDLFKLLESADFGKIYGYELKKRSENKKAISGDVKVRGEWKRYPKNSDHRLLVNSLKGKNTGWCTAGESIAKSQLSEGDFHVYYNLDDQGNTTQPRIAIRMRDQSIAEIRGIGPQQNMDPGILNSDILSKKMLEFGDESRRYFKKDSDMKHLTALERKNANNEGLTSEDLAFLYEIHSPIEGFGYSKDPRIEELRQHRDLQSDLASIFHVSRSEISTRLEDAFRPETRVHAGGLYMEDLATGQLPTRFPEVWIGNIYLDRITSADELQLPKRMVGNLNLHRLKEVRKLRLPQFMSGRIELDGLESAENVVFPQEMKGFLSMNSLMHVRGLRLPDVMNGDVRFWDLPSTQIPIPPRNMTGKIFQPSLEEE